MTIARVDIMPLYEEKHGIDRYDEIYGLIKRLPIVPEEFIVMNNRRTPIYNVDDLICALEDHKHRKFTTEKTVKLCDEVIDLLKDAKWAK